MRIGFISGKTSDLYRVDELAKKHDVSFCIPPWAVGAVGRLGQGMEIAQFMEEKWDYVICGDVGDHAAGLALHFEQKGVRLFGGGSVHAVSQENPDYLTALGHRVGVPIGGEAQSKSGTRIRLACLMSRKGPCGPAWLMETTTRLGPVRAPGVVVCCGVPVPVESRLWQDVCKSVGKIFSAFHCSGVAVMEVDVADKLNILNLSLEPPEGFWAMWHAAYAGDDVGEVFSGLANGKEFNYPVCSGQLFAAVLLTVPPYPTSHLPKLRLPASGPAHNFFPANSLADSLTELVKGVHYKGLEELYCVEALKHQDTVVGHGTKLGWKVIADDERDLATSLQLLSEDLDDQYIQVPHYVPGLDFGYTRDFLLTEGLL
jgi:hypothetical protein